MVGRGWNRGVLYVGRAVNGWGETNPLRAETLDQADAVEKAIDYSLGSCGWDQSRETCPILDWYELMLVKKQKKEISWNIHKSRFWSVIKECAGDGPDWTWQVAWTNLYKLSPAAGRNPQTWLKNATFEACLAMLSAEIGHLEPRAVVFQTGWWWAKPFIDRLGVEAGHEIGVIAGQLCWVGVYPAVGKIPLVVVPHPERKKKAPIVETIREQLKEAA